MQDKQQIYGRNDMVMLEKHNKIYGSLGLTESFVFDTIKGERMVVLNNPKQGMFKDVVTNFELTGNTQQDSTTGKNLFDIDSFLKLPLQQDANGFKRELKLKLKPNTKYVLSTNNEGSCESQDRDKSRSLYFSNVSDNMLNCTSTACFKGKNVVVISDENGMVKITLFDRTNSKPIENKECYVMLNEGASSAPYEPYTGGKPSPSPDYPQEIISTGRKSRNLFDINNIDETTCVTTAQNQAFAKDPLYVLSNMIPVKQGKSIVKGNSGSKMCIFLDENKEPILSTKASVEDGKAIEVPSGAHYFCFNILKTKLSNNVMCNIGKVLLPYEPYMDKYLFDVKVTGKNLLNEEQTITITSDRPITKWDKLVEQDGQIGWLYGGRIIESYNSESIDTEYMSTTGELSVGATILYKLKVSEFIPLPQSEQDAIRALKTYYPTTVITVDGGELPVGIEVTYKQVNKG